MGKTRKTIVILLAVAMALVSALTWGSLGSICLMLCLGAMGVALLYQHFLINQEDSDYDIEGWN